jgi:predicted SPOUT superfamily RNA methylase MTH1
MEVLAKIKERNGLTPKRKVKLTIAIPASIVAEFKGLREKTEIIGRLARSAAVFRVEEIVIYPNEPNEAQLVKTLLSYVETPQYLRKHIFNVRPELQYAGILPPLRTPHHPLGNRVSSLHIGEYREGVLIQDQNGAIRIDIGVDQMLKLLGKAPSPGTRLTVKVTQIHPNLEGVIAKVAEIPDYWGFKIQVLNKSIGEIAHGGFYDLSIATSRTGKAIADKLDELKAKMAESRSIFVAFGSPRDGLQEILSQEKRKVEDTFNYNFNTVPDQGCETVRTEEAIHATLALLNILQ